jgi:hypothetical protein
MGIVILEVELRYRHGDNIHLRIFKPSIGQVCCLAANVEISAMPNKFSALINLSTMGLFRMFLWYHDPS